MNENTKRPMRIVIGILAAAYIVYMLVRTDIVAILSTMPADRLLPIFVICMVFLLIKFVFQRGIAFLIKWLRKDKQ